MIVDCAHYRDGRRQHEGPWSWTRPRRSAWRRRRLRLARAVRARPTRSSPTCRSRFGLHELAVEDAQSFHLRPKIEHYEEARLLRRPAHRPLRRRARGGRVRRGIGLHLAPASSSPCARARRAICTARGCGWSAARSCSRRARPRCCGRSSTRSSTTTRRSSRASSATSRRSSRPSSAAPSAPTERIYLLRREATDFYRAVHPLLGPLDALERGAYSRSTTELSQFFRDVNDHLKLVNEEVVAQRDLLATVLQANMAVISVRRPRSSVRQNETMKQLTLDRDDLPAADVHHRLLRDELRLADRPHRPVLGVPRLRPRQPPRLGATIFLWFRRGQAHLPQHSTARTPFSTQF